MRRVLYVRVGAWAAALLLGTSAANGASKRLPQSIQTPNETAAPALTGTITQYPTFPLRVSKTFQTIWAERYFSTTSGLGGIGTDPLLNSLLTISYNARTGVYTLKDTADSETMSATFRPTSRTTQGSIDYYRTSSPTATDQLQLYNNVRLGTSATGAPVRLTYLSYGAWSHDNLTTGATWERYFLFGYPTASRDMPLSGTASYSTAVSANVRTEIPSAGDAMLRGSATFTANFAQGIVNTSLTLAYSDSISYAYSGSAPISASSFSGPFSSSTDPYFNLGSFAGSFYGPRATEMGYVFAIERGEADPYAGASVAPPLSWIVGAVVGKKN